MPIAIRVLLSLSLAAVLVIGCGKAGRMIPESASGLPTLVEATANQTATALPAEASTPESVHSLPILLSLPADDSPPFEGYKSADYGAAVDDLTKWIDKWSVAKGIGTDVIGGVLQLVPLEGGGVGALVQSGSYYTEGRKTYLVIPIDKVNGGLQAHPADGTVGEGTDKYPLFVTTDLDENLELVGTGTNQVYQAFKVDGNGKKVFTWYVNPKDNEKGKAGAKIAGEYVAPVDYSQAFFDPQSEADLAKVIQAPSPFDDPEGFAKWQDGYLAADLEKLKAYTGPVFTTDGAGIDFESSSIVFQGSDYSGTEEGVLSSYKIKWNNETVAVKTYVLELPDKSRVPFSVAYSNHEQKNPYGLKTPTGKVIVYFAYGYVVAPYHAADQFEEEYFKALNTSADFDGWRRLLAGKGTDQDKTRFSRTPFVIFSVQDS